MRKMMYLHVIVLSVIIFFKIGCKIKGTEPEPDPMTLVLTPVHVTVNGGADGSIDLTVTGGTAPYQYQWSNGETTEDIMGLFAGTYSVTVTDANADLMTDSTTITQPDEPGTVTDYNGNVYLTIQIGNQEWMAENLKTTHATDGTPLNGVYAYNDDENNVEEYGRLYTWESANNASPEGWHLPTNAEWDVLISTLGSNAADKLKYGGSSGFSAKMAGHLSQGSYEYIGTLGKFWTSTESGDGIHAMLKFIIVNESNVITDNELMNCGLSVRCIKD